MGGLKRPPRRKTTTDRQPAQRPSALDELAEEMRRYLMVPIYMRADQYSRSDPAYLRMKGKATATEHWLGRIAALKKENPMPDEKKSRCHETFHNKEDCPDCSPKQPEQPDVVISQVAGNDLKFTPGLADSIVSGDPAGREAYEAFHNRKPPPVPAAATNRFRLSQIGVQRVNVDSEPSREMTKTAMALGHERPDGHDWTDIVVTVTDRAGNVFEVARVTCKYDGILGESTAAATLVQRMSWDNAIGDGIICPLCYERGHGAGACNRR